MNRFVLAFVMMMCLLGTLVTIIAFGIDKVSLAQMIIAVAALIAIGYAVARDL